MMFEIDPEESSMSIPGMLDIMAPSITKSSLNVPEIAGAPGELRLKFEDENPDER